MPHVLITGGTGGIGFGVAEAMLAAGYSVTVTGVTEPEVAAAPTRPSLSARRLDVTNDDSVSELIGTLGPLDALVNCAGIIDRAREFEIETFRHVLEVNLVGTMRMCLAVRPLLVGAGSIVNTASMLAFFGGALVPGYSASKGGVVQLTKSLAAAWAGEGIRVNAVAPGWIDTELTHDLVADQPRSAGILARTPMKRWGKPSDVGAVVVFLCSDAARFITGATLPVDGGYLAV